MEEQKRLSPYNVVYMVDDKFFLVVSSNIKLYEFNLESEPIELQESPGECLAWLCEDKYKSLTDSEYRKYKHKYASYLSDTARTKTIDRVKKAINELYKGQGLKLGADYVVNHKDGYYSLNAKEIIKYPLYTDLTLKAVYLQGTSDSNAIYLSPETYIEPQEALNSLKRDAFREKNIHMITGPRGIGKTELAQCFIRHCIQNNLSLKENHYNSIYTVKYCKSLSYTIAHMDCDRLDFQHKDIYNWRLNMDFLMNRAPKPCLLLIDNYNNPNARKEFSLNNEVYKALRESKCDILITSQISLKNNYDIPTTEMFPLPADALYQLFCADSSLSEIILAKEEEKIKRFIQDSLYANTYLVKLFAGLAQTRNLDEMIAAFNEMNVHCFTESLEIMKDNVIEEDSLISLFNKMMRLSDIWQSDDFKQILTNLALLPLDGIEYSKFFSIAFEGEDTARMQAVFNQLRKTYWCFLKDRKVCLHPLIRELILTQMVPEDLHLIQPFVNSIIRINRLEVFTPILPQVLLLALSSQQALEVIDPVWQDKNSALLLSSIASNYDLLRNDATYSYAKKALLQLNALQINKEDNFDMAFYFNTVGYSLLHAYQEVDSLVLAKTAFLKAEALLSDCRNEEDTSLKVRLLLSKVHSNMGAAAAQEEDYNTALDYHKETYHERTVLMAQWASEELSRLTAVACRCIATDYYKWSKHIKGDAQVRFCLDQSMNYHIKGISLLVPGLETHAAEYYASGNRLVSTWFYRHNLYPYIPYTEKDLDFLLKIMGSVSDCLIQQQIPIQSERKDCLINSTKILELICDYSFESHSYEQISAGIPECRKILKARNSSAQLNTLDSIDRLRRIMETENVMQNTGKTCQH